jgi:hypothetical protein
MGGKARQTEGGWRAAMPEMSYALGTPPHFDACGRSSAPHQKASHLLRVDCER